MSENVALGQIESEQLECNSSHSERSREIVLSGRLYLDSKVSGLQTNRHGVLVSITSIERTMQLSAFHFPCDTHEP